MLQEALLIGLKPIEFWSMTDNEFFVYLEGHNKRQYFQKDIMRNIMWSNMVDGKLKRNTKPHTWMHFEYDKVISSQKQLAENVSKEEFEIKRQQIRKLWEAKKKSI